MILKLLDLYYDYHYLSSKGQKSKGMVGRQGGREWDGVTAGIHFETEKYEYKKRFQF
jgi:hypothetical protein